MVGYFLVSDGLWIFFLITTTKCNLPIGSMGRTVYLPTNIPIENQPFMYLDVPGS